MDQLYFNVSKSSSDLHFPLHLVEYLLLRLLDQQDSTGLFDLFFEFVIILVAARRCQGLLSADFIRL